MQVPNLNSRVAEKEVSKKIRGKTGASNNLQYTRDIGLQPSTALRWRGWLLARSESCPMPNGSPNDTNNSPWWIGREDGTDSFMDCRGVWVCLFTVRHCGASRVRTRNARAMQLARGSRIIKVSRHGRVEVGDGGMDCGRLRCV